MTPIFALHVDGVPRVAFTYAEVAEMCSISVWQVKHLVKSGKLDAPALGERARRVTAASLWRLLNERDEAVA
jgi:hypothetical protein